jgi:hypothetical protein
VKRVCPKCGGKFKPRQIGPHSRWCKGTGAATPSTSAASATVLITVDEFRFERGFGSLQELQVYFTDFAQQVESARKMIPLAFLGAKPAAEPARRLKPAATGRTGKRHGVDCPNCGKHFGAENAWYRKHAAGCSPKATERPTRGAAVGHRKVVVIGRPIGQRSQVENAAAGKFGVGFALDGEPMKQELEGCTHAIVMRYAPPGWHVLAQNCLSRDKIIIADDARECAKAVERLAA